jgi:hypothetical protein
MNRGIAQMWLLRVIWSLPLGCQKDTNKNFSTHRCGVLYSCLLPCLKTSNT